MRPWGGVANTQLTAERICSFMLTAEMCESSDVSADFSRSTSLIHDWTSKSSLLNAEMSIVPPPSERSSAARAGGGARLFSRVVGRPSAAAGGDGPLWFACMVPRGVAACFTRRRTRLGVQGCRTRKQVVQEAALRTEGTYVTPRLRAEPARSALGSSGRPVPSGRSTRSYSTSRSVLHLVDHPYLVRTMASLESLAAPPAVPVDPASLVHEVISMQDAAERLGLVTLTPNTAALMVSRYEIDRGQCNQL